MVITSSWWTCSVKKKLDPGISCSFPSQCSPHWIFSLVGVWPSTCRFLVGSSQCCCHVHAVHMCFVYVIFDGTAHLTHCCSCKYSAGACLHVFAANTSSICYRPAQHALVAVCVDTMYVYSYFAPPHDSVILVLHCKGSLTDGWLTVNHPPICTSNYHSHACRGSPQLWN